MARIIDLIEYPNEMRDEIVHQFPETGQGNYRIGSQLIVRESQAAVFFRWRRLGRFRSRQTHHRHLQHSPINRPNREAVS